MTTVYYEDIAVGDTEEHGEYTVTAEEIVEFAEQYDPQPFHVDRAAAAESPFEGLIASGWHTASICMRLLVYGPLGDQAGMGARGVDELRWHRPVRPGDSLSIRTEVLEKRPSESDPEKGYVDNRLTGLVDGEPVISWIGLGMVARRPDTADVHNEKDADSG